MVHVVTPRPSIGSALGNALGSVAGNEVGYQINRSREQNQFQQQQQRQMQQKQLEQSMLEQSLNKAQEIYANPNLSPEDKLIGLHQALTNRPDIASALGQQLQKSQKLTQTQNLLNKLFGPAQQPQQNIDQQNQEQKQFSPESLNDSQIAEITSLDPNLGRLLQSQKESIMREKRSQQEFEERKRKESPEYKRETQLTQAQAQADVKYNQSLQETSKQHALKKQTLDRLEKLNLNGVTGKPFEKILEKTGLVNLTSEGRREFAAEVKNLITDIRSILGSQFTGFEFQTILNAYPSPDFSKEANEAIIKNLKEFQDIKSKEVEIAKELKKENNGKIPEDFQAKVNEKVTEYANSKVPEIKQNSIKIMNEEYGITPGNTLMFDNRGDPLDVPPQDVEKLKQLGATLP